MGIVVERHAGKLSLPVFREDIATPEMKENQCVRDAGEGKETRELSLTWLFNP